MNKSLVGIASILGLAICAGYFWGVQFLLPLLPDLETSGQFGDTFGALNAFFSGLAFLGVIYAIYLQKEELGLQRRELTLTREELGRTADAQEKSEQALSKQAASLKIGAKLNALSAELSYYNARMQEKGSHGHNIIQENQEAQRLLQEIRGLVADKMF